MGDARGRTLRAARYDGSRTDGLRRFDRLSRIGDLAGCVVAIGAALPLALLVALVILIVDPGPILFAQPRIGRHGRPFLCLKFRTMYPGAHDRLTTLLAVDEKARRQWARHHKLIDDPRVTPLGRLLRRLSIDEWPQILNVLLGDMSLVGPRPIVAAEAARYGRGFAAYCSVRPGLTGLWQVSGRTDLSYDRRVALDIAYVATHSVALDLRILAATVPCVLGRGAY